MLSVDWGVSTFPPVIPMLTLPVKWHRTLVHQTLRQLCAMHAMFWIGLMASGRICSDSPDHPASSC